jgi:hypothetical protein
MHLEEAYLFFISAFVGIIFMNGIRTMHGMERTEL